tara:strand:- start:1551 stop:1913 length:363 start_codon:yes stop_codon:yes gene_type:complete
MSNYTIQTGWSGKDALADSDPAKVISGDDFNTEFLAVQAAINTKAELNGNVSESFSALTAATGTNTTQVATTAFVQAATPPMGINTVIVDGAAGATGKNIYIDNDAPVSEGNDGDVWFEY